MKLNKTSWILVVIGVLVVAGVCLGLLRSQQTDKQKQLQDKLVLAQKKLASINYEDLISQKERLALEIEGYQGQAAGVKKALTFPEDSISISGQIFNTARSCGVDVANMTSTGRVKAELYGTPCSSLPVNIEASGSYGEISNFLYALSREFPTSTVTTVQAKAEGSNAVTSLSSSVTPLPYPSATAPEKTAAIKAIINMVIYTYEIKSNVE